jgi:hypothetical protein
MGVSLRAGCYAQGRAEPKASPPIRVTPPDAESPPAGGEPLLGLPPPVFLRAPPSRAPRAFRRRTNTPLRCAQTPFRSTVSREGPFRLLPRSRRRAEVQQLLHLATKKERNPVMSDNDQLSAQILRQFTGTENWYRHAINRKGTAQNTLRNMPERSGYSTKSPSFSPTTNAWPPRNFRCGGSRCGTITPLRFAVRMATITSYSQRKSSSPIFRSRNSRSTSRTM